MKVLHVIDRLEIGGAEKLFVSITKLLSTKSIVTGALLFTKGSPLDNALDKDVQLHVLNRRHKFDPLTLYKAHKICNGYDIVHTHLRHVYAYIRLAQWLFGGRYKLIIHDHAAITDGIPERLSGILKPAYYIGVNKQQTKWAESKVGVEKEKIFLLENTVLPVAATCGDARGTDRMMIVSNIREVKNIEFAIDLSKRMKWQLDIYGNTIEPDYYNLLLARIGGNKNISIQQGVTDLSTFYGEYDLAIHCAPAETGPLVLIEYLAAGLPFIAYKTGSAADAIAEELPQLFMDNFEPSLWQQRMREILVDEKLSTKMRELFNKKFNPEEYINKCLDIYRKIYS